MNHKRLSADPFAFDQILQQRLIKRLLGIDQYIVNLMGQTFAFIGFDKARNKISVFSADVPRLGGQFIAAFHILELPVLTKVKSPLHGIEHVEYNDLMLFVAEMFQP